jgi:hypothetical protein
MAEEDLTYRCRPSRLDEGEQCVCTGLHNLDEASLEDPLEDTSESAS